MNVSGTWVSLPGYTVCFDVLLRINEWTVPATVGYSGSPHHQLGSRQASTIPRIATFTIWAAFWRAASRTAVRVESDIVETVEGVLGTVGVWTTGAGGGVVVGAVAAGAAVGAAPACCFSFTQRLRLVRYLYHNPSIKRRWLSPATGALNLIFLSLLAGGVVPLLEALLPLLAARLSCFAF